MASRRDQYQAYRFVTRRHTGALLREDSDTADAPLRRLSNGTFGGVLIGLLAMAVAGLWGLLSPSSAPGWQNGKSLIMARDNGARYVYLDGKLHPVLNYASALLILKSGAVTPVTVSRGALDTVEQGRPIGIAGGPDSIPSPGAIVTGPWTVCNDQAETSLTVPLPVVTLYVGTSAGVLTPLPATSAVLVQDLTGTQYLVWNGERLRLSSEAPAALGYTGQALPVAPAWINALPSGPDLTPPEPPDLGSAGPEVDGAASKVGELFSVDSAAYVMEPDGLAAITPLQERLLQADRNEENTVYGGGAVTPRAVDVSALGHLSGTHPASINGLPQTVPAAVNVSTGSVSVCATLASGSQGTVTLATRTVAPTVATAAAEPTDHGTDVAATVDLAAAHGALVKLTSSVNDTIGTEYLVTDLGIKYPIAGPSVLSDLGLSTIKATALPPGFVDLMPTGPALSEQAAAAVQPDDPNG
jgi:type VII secretion protein EccB